jgi:hypothetical protein
MAISVLKRHLLSRKFGKSNYGYESPMRAVPSAAKIRNALTLSPSVSLKDNDQSGLAMPRKQSPLNLSRYN